MAIQVNTFVLLTYLFFLSDYAVLKYAILLAFFARVCEDVCMSNNTRPRTRYQTKPPAMPVYVVDLTNGQTITLDLRTFEVR